LPLVLIVCMAGCSGHRPPATPEATRDSGAAPSVEHVESGSAPGQTATPVATPGARHAAVNGRAAKKPKQRGVASWYGRRNSGKKTASGERFDPKKLTAAHRTLPLGSKAKVTNVKTGQSTEVTINDRGPYVKGRSIDLSSSAAQEIGISEKGTAPVTIEAVPEARGTAGSTPQATPRHE